MNTLRRQWPVALCFALAFALTMGRAADERIVSDEQLFLGGAGLMARGGGLIYRDFFYNHMPTQALLTAALFRLTSRWTLAARAVDALCGAGVVALLFAATRRALAGMAAAQRNVVASAIAAAFLVNPITAAVVGKAWNHDFPALLSLAGFLLLAAAVAPVDPAPNATARRVAALTLAAGACASLAATSRLTYATALPAFGLLLLLAPGHAPRARVRLFALVCAGAAIAAIPAAIVWLAAPSSAYFDNFRFPSFTARYHADTTSDHRLLFSWKFEYASNTLEQSPSTVILLAAGLAAIVAAWRPWQARASAAQARLTALALLIVCTSASAFAPTPMFRQYLFCPLPFVALAIAWSFAAQARWAWPRAGAMVVAAIACVALGADDYVPGLRRLTAGVATWAPVRAHADAIRLREMARPGRVVTFAPGIPLEAGLPIDDALSIGRYGVRIAPYLSRKQRAAVHLKMLSEIGDAFDRVPPGAVLLTTPQTPDERELAAMAIAHGYRRRNFGDGRFVYLPTRASAQPSTRPTTKPAERKETPGERRERLARQRAKPNAR